MKACDILLIGVGGQGVVTLGDLIARAALAASVPFSLVPTKGMAQRGGFVKVDLRLGHAAVGPRIPAYGADIVLSMERSEALKGLPFVRPDGRVILYDHVWEPTGVLLGENTYPSRRDVLASLKRSCSEIVLLDPSVRPTFDGAPVVSNIYALGALAGSQRIRNLVDSRAIERVVIERWPSAAETNLAAFQAGFIEGNQPVGPFLGGADTRKQSEEETE
jgi:indolepyruvate ferredoxin oxidoreductase, beta subunit